MEKGIIKVGVVQASPALFNLEKTVEIIITWIERAAFEGCQLVLFPESFIPCYPRGLNFDAIIGKRTDKSRIQWLDYWNHCPEIPSKYLDKIGESVKKVNLIMALGITEKEGIGGSLFCTLVYFDNQGKIVGKHRKLKPTGLERYLWAEGDGTGLISLDTPIGKIGGLICWENYMPLARMALYNQGIEIYLAPTADSRESWKNTLQHIALEGRCFVLSSNQFVKKSDYPEIYQEDLKNEPDIMCPGGSLIISPMGEVLAGPLWNEEGLLVAELDFSLLAKSKLDFDVLGHYSRKDVFKFEVVEQPSIRKII